MKDFFRLWWHSIIDFNSYKKFMNFNLPVVLRYLLILLCITSFVLSLGISVRVSKFVKEAGDWTVENLPVISITNGVVDVEAQMPFRIEKEGFEIILDTTGQTLSIDNAVEHGMLLTKNKLILKQSELQTNTYDLSEIRKLTLNKDSIERWKKNAFRVTFPLIFVTSFVYYAIAKALQVLLFSLLPLAISSVKDFRFKYRQIINISVFSLTLPFILAVLIEAFHFRVGFFPLLFIFIYVVYLIKGTLACGKTADIKKD